jgi:RecB family exonuclease
MISTSREIVVASSLHAVEQIAARGGRAETLSGLRRRLAAKLAPHLTIASAEMSRMALAEALAHESLREHDLSKVVQAFDDAIGALFSVGSTIGMLERIAKKKGAPAERAALLARAMRGLQESLAAVGLVDRRALPSELADAIGRASPAEVARAVGADRLVAKWITRWQPADLLWWRALDAALSRVGGHAKLELPIVTKKIDAERERDPLEVLIDELAQRLDAAPDTVAIESRFGDLRFADDDVPHDVDLRRASNEDAQARAIADAVMSALANGARTDEIAIVLPEPNDSSSAAIARVFQAIGIPLHVPNGDAPLASPVVGAALNALSFVTEEASRIELRALEQSPFIGENLRERLIQFRATHDPKSTWRDRIADARTLWSQIDLEAKPTKSVRDTLAHDRPRDSLDALEMDAHASNARGWRALHASIDAIEASAARLKISGRPVSAAEFVRTLQRSLESRSAAPAASLAGAVFLGRISDVANESLALLVIADAHEGALPANAAVPAVLTDAVATQLREMDAARAPLFGHVHHAMIWASVAAAAANAKRVVVTYRAQGVDGDALGPSPLVAWLARAGISETDWHSGPLAGKALHSSDARLRNLAFDEKTRVIVAPASARRAETERARESFHSRHVVSATVGDVSASTASIAMLERAMASPARPLSLTALEEIAKCNFRGYARAVLGVREPDTLNETPDNRERGVLVHEALHAAFDATMDLWSERPRNRELIRERALEAARKSLRAHDVADQMSTMRVALRGVVHRQVLEELTRIVEFSLDDERFDAVRAEQSFGRPKKEGSWDALALQHEGTNVFLQGDIDRVDVAHDDHRRVRAVDYKSSPNVAKEAHKKLGLTTLQVPFYARAAMIAMNSERAEGLYLPGRDIPSALSNREKFEAQWEKIGALEKSNEGLAARAVEIIVPLRLGNLLPHPHRDDFTVCDRCAYDGICRRPRFVVNEDETEEEP